MLIGSQEDVCLEEAVMGSGTDLIIPYKGRFGKQATKVTKIQNSTHAQRELTPIQYSHSRWDA